MLAHSRVADRVAPVDNLVLIVRTKTLEARRSGRNGVGFRYRTRE